MICVYIYIYIYIYILHRPTRAARARKSANMVSSNMVSVALKTAVFSVVSRIIVICYAVRKF